MDINYICTRKRREFGKPCAFTDIGPSLILELDPDPSLKEEFSALSIVDRVIDNSKKTCVHEVNTLTFPTEARGMNHVEGGWPAAVDNADEESMARFRKKIEKDKGYVNTVKSLADFLENFIMENNSVDIYEEYFEGETIKRGTDWSLTVLNVYQDLADGGVRSIADFSWRNDSAKFAAVYTLKKTNGSPTMPCLDSYVWDVEDNIKPVYVMKPEVPMTVAEFSPTHPDLIVGGYINGQIALWDIRTDARAKLSTVTESHTEKVTGLKWLQSKQGTAFFSTSSDGKIMSWDVRNMASPTEIVSLDKGETSFDQSYTIRCAEYDATLPDKFMVGTDQAIVLSFNRRFKHYEDKLSFRYDTLGGPVLALERNAFYPQLFASCDAWSLKLWSESVTDTAVLNVVSQEGYFTDFAWSPSRASTLYATKTTGILEIWDVPGKNKQPLLNMKLDDEALLSVAVSPSGNQLVCGTLSGCVQLLNIPEYLRSTSDLEAELVRGCVRECYRVLGGSSRSHRIVQRREEDSSLEGVDEEWWDPPDKAEDLYEEYKELFKDFPSESEES